jgi:hypothetical protein
MLAQQVFDFVMNVCSFPSDHQDSSGFDSVLCGESKIIMFGHIWLLLVLWMTTHGILGKCLGR